MEVEIQETRHVQSTVRQPNAHQTALSRNLPGYFITPQKYQPLSPPEIKERTNKIYEKKLCVSQEERAHIGEATGAVTVKLGTGTENLA